MVAGACRQCLTRWIASRAIVTVSPVASVRSTVPVEREALLRDLALEDGDRGGAVVVVVEAGVVAGHPADR